MLPPKIIQSEVKLFFSASAIGNRQSTKIVFWFFRGLSYDFWLSTFSYPRQLFFEPNRNKQELNLKGKSKTKGDPTVNHFPPIWSNRCPRFDWCPYERDTHTFKRTNWTWKSKLKQKRNELRKSIFGYFGKFLFWLVFRPNSILNRPYLLNPSLFAKILFFYLACRNLVFLF